MDSLGKVPIPRDLPSLVLLLLCVLTVEGLHPFGAESDPQLILGVIEEKQLLVQFLVVLPVG
jgi:hypothetical protein